MAATHRLFLHLYIQTISLSNPLSPRLNIMATPKLLTLPVEIREKIVGLLMPFAFESGKFPGDARNLPNDLYYIFENVQHLHVLYRESPTMRQFLGQKVLRTVKLNTMVQKWFVLEFLTNVPINIVDGDCR